MSSASPASSPSAEPSIRFAFQPSTQSWYLAHNVSIVTAYLDHRDLAERENRVERFFINSCRSGVTAMCHSGLRRRAGCVWWRACGVCSAPGAVQEFAIDAR